MANSLDTKLVAKRWAHALMELALESDEISKSDILDDLREVSDTIENSDELCNVINNPSISTEEKQVVICKLFENKIMPIVYNFLYVLNLRKRFSLIKEIAEAFKTELEEYNNIARIDIISAVEVNDEKKNDIKSKISEKLHKEVMVDWNVDSDIIAGLIFNINDTVIDNSVRHKLEELSKKIIR